MFAALHGPASENAQHLRLAFAFSPFVEQSTPDTVALDVSGLERLLGLPQDVAAAMAKRAAEMGVQVSIAVADTPDAAIYAARGFRGVHVIPYGDEAKYLGTLPLELLAPSAELAGTLDRWGIRRFQDLAALPPLGIAERLGPEGMRLHELARGGWPRKLLTLTDPLRFEDEIELDYPVDLLEPLAFLLARLLNGLTTALATRGLATDELRLRLKLEDRTTHERTLRLPVPALDAKAFLKLMQLDLEAHPPAAPVERIWMAANPVKPRPAQNGLFIPVAPEPVKLELTIARIEALVGAGHIGTPEVIDTHRPDAFRMVKFGTAAALDPPPAQLQVRMALRLFRPPRAARVTLDGGQPHAVAADGVRGRIVSMAGPWRSSGDWWTADPWSRDEWDVALTDGALYRIFCCPRGWFVEGSYD